MGSEVGVTMTELKTNWYVINVFSGMEDKVIRLIREKAKKKGLDSYFLDLLSPKQETTEVKAGVKKQKMQAFYPGYILVRMALNDDTRHLVHSIDQVTGFLGGDKERPTPISSREVERILNTAESKKKEPEVKATFMVGEHVNVIDGPFKGLGGMVEIISDKNRLKISAMVFGRPTPIEVDFQDVERASTQ